MKLLFFPLNVAIEGGGCLCIEFENWPHVESNWWSLVCRLLYHFLMSNDVFLWNCYIKQCIIHCREGKKSHVFKTSLEQTVNSMEARHGSNQTASLLQYNQAQWIPQELSRLCYVTYMTVIWNVSWNSWATIERRRLFSCLLFLLL